MQPPPRLVTVERRYLALPSPAAFRPKAGGIAPGAEPTLRQLAPDEFVGWRRLYREVGGPWQWVDRNAWSDAQLAQYLAQPAVSVWAVDEPASAARDIGMIELAAHHDGSVEIVYLGLVPAYHGRGAGAWLLEQAVTLGWQLGATRIWLHTCSLDAPAALPNYLARGFQLERTEHYIVTLPG